MVVNYVTKETAGSSAERPLMAEPVESFDPNDLFAQGCLQYIKFLTAFECTTTWWTQADVTSASQHTTLAQS
jgi:hypothetical protein